MAGYSKDLLAQLDEFQLVVAPTAEIRSDILSAYTQWKRKTSSCWSVPTIQTWDEHLRHVWRRSRHEFTGYLLLSPHEFRYRWMEAGLETFRTGLEDPDHSGEFIWMSQYVSSICDDAMEAWALLHDYKIPLQRPQQGDSLQTRFFDWVCRFRETAREQNWLTDAELPGFLAGRLRSNDFFSKYGRHTLFVTLPRQKKIRDEYIAEYVCAAAESGQACSRISLSVPEPADERTASEPDSLQAFEFADTNRELQAAAAQALEWLNQAERKPQSCADSRSVRIGIVVPNLGPVRTRIRRQFLATFCPNGHWAWQVPQFTANVRPSLVDSPVCAEILSYLRALYSESIVFSRARALVRSGNLSGVIPERDLDSLKKHTKHDQDIDSEIISPLRKKTKFGERHLSKWMKVFACAIEDCRSGLADHRRAEFCDVFHRYVSSGRRRAPDDLGDLIEAFTVTEGPSSLLIETAVGMNRPAATRTAAEAARLHQLETLIDCSDEHRVLDRLLELGEKQSTPGRHLSAAEEARLGRLDGLIELLRNDSVIRRLLELSTDLGEFAASQDKEMRFDDAYGYLSSACAMERAPSFRVSAPVEILSHQQAVGRHFTHLWFVGMRDTDWPPLVSPSPLLGPRVLQKHAPILFDRESAHRYTEEVFRSLVERCEDRSAIRLSYAIRDSGSERVHMGADTVDALAHEPGDSSNQDVEDLLDHHAESPTHGGINTAGDRKVTWATPPEHLSRTLFHPSCSVVGDNVAEHVTVLDAGTELDESVTPKTEETLWLQAEYATQYECPFKAFAMHRLRVEAPARRFGSPGMTERRSEVTEFCKFIESISSGKIQKNAWERWKIWENCNPEPIADAHGMYTFTSNKMEYVVDCTVGLDGRYAPGHLRRDGNAGESRSDADLPRMSGITRDSYDKFMERKKLYPVRVIHYAVEQQGAVIPGYVTNERMDFVKYIGNDKKKPPAAVHWMNEWKKVKGKLEDWKGQYIAGKMIPDPVGGEGPGEPVREVRRVAELCRGCHLQTACRYNHVGEPTW